MIEAINTSPRAEAQKGEPQNTDGAPFSLALATASLEARAGAALQSFGGTPEAASAEAIGANATKAGGGEPVPLARASTTENASAEPAPASSSPSPAPVQERASPANAPGAATNLQAPIAAASVVSVGAGQNAALVQNIAGRAAVSSEAAALRIHAARAEAQKPGAMSAPPAPAATPETFSRLLARRLDSGATSFEMRLDPPELGRVEARLTVGDNGKAALALKFDNQAAFEQFSRDSEAIRATLVAAGYDVADASLTFEFAERNDNIALTNVEAPATALSLSFDSIEPNALAEHSAGVIDIRI